MLIAPDVPTRNDVNSCEGQLTTEDDEITRRQVMINLKENGTNPFDGFEYMPKRSNNFFNKNVGINSEPKRNIKVRSMPNNRS